MNKIIKDIKEALNTDNKTKAYDTQAKVIRSEGQTLWVHIPGGVDETPVKKTINAKAGDTVQVRVSGGSAWLVGNQSAPPTDDTRAIVAETTAITANENATIAAQAAESAVESANVASAAAASAQTSASNALTAAQNAQTSADSALVSLSTVEDVVGVLNWITAHGTMTLTSDVAINPAHVYFVVDPVGDYVVGGTHYSIVAEPKVEDISTYYELSVDESVQNYVATHVVVDTEGLWLIPDSGGNKVLIATGAGSTYTTAGTYIIGKVNGLDTVFAKFLQTGSTMSAENGTQIAHLGYGNGINSSGGTSKAPYYSIGLRKNNSTVGNYSTAEGYDTTASGFVSHAEGHSTTASGSYSHAEGGPVGGGGVQLPAPVASGSHSHAEGCYTVASELYSHAQNLGTIANGIGQTVIGKYNIADNYHTLIVGNGGSDSQRSNALTIDSFGNVDIASGANYMIDGVPIGGGGGGSVDPSTTTPIMDGVASVGSETKYARGDHIHPSDTSKQDNLVSGTNIKTVNGNSLLGNGNLSIGTAKATDTIWGNVKVQNGSPEGSNTYMGIIFRENDSIGFPTLNGSYQIDTAVIPLATTTKLGAMSATDKTKLDGIESGAQVNIMTAADKTKLDGIESGAEVNVLEGVQLNGTDLTITNKKVNVPVLTGATASTNGEIGLVPKPTSGQQTYFLFGNGTWDKLYVTTSSSGPSQFTADIEQYTSGNVVASINIPSATTTKAGVLSATDKTKLDNIYPVGAVFETIDSTTDPSALYGGTWSVYGQLETDSGVYLETDDGEMLFAGGGYEVEPTYRWVRVA